MHVYTCNVAVSIYDSDRHVPCVYTVTPPPPPPAEPLRLWDPEPDQSLCAKYTGEG